MTSKHGAHLISPALTPVSEHPPSTGHNERVKGNDKWVTTLTDSEYSHQERLAPRNGSDAVHAPKDSLHSFAVHHQHPGAGSDNFAPAQDTFTVISPAAMHETPKSSGVAIQELTLATDSTPARISSTPVLPIDDGLNTRNLNKANVLLRDSTGDHRNGRLVEKPFKASRPAEHTSDSVHESAIVEAYPSPERDYFTPSSSLLPRPHSTMRANSTPTFVQRRKSDTAKTDRSRPQLDSIASHRRQSNAREASRSEGGAPDPFNLGDPFSSLPLQTSIPLPPFSMPTYLHLELSSDRPSPLYISPSSYNDTAYESAKVKFERLLNFLVLPPKLEQVLLFGSLTCLDAWLYMFTILPLRFLKAIWILLEFFAGTSADLVQAWFSNLYSRLRKVTRGEHCNSNASANAEARVKEQWPSSGTPQARQHRSHSGTKSSQPVRIQESRRASSYRGQRQKHAARSLLKPSHKADMLQGLLIVASCAILTRFDASRMYHAIRGQAAIKLYVIYNVLEVCDRLFAALGQDILECLFSSETLERGPNGRSKVMRPFWMFILALVYTVIHSTALFYQVITLNVAVNSYSNALLTLLMSNQFVEIKGTVFKKFEKENFFQLTCADIVERFQLWLMLLIIALRNIVELGGLTVGSSESTGPSSAGSSPSNSNASSAPLRSFNILPHAFTILPSSFPTQVLGPFLLVLGSEMVVDWLKHAYITKFNATSPRIYARFLDVLAKDYYSHAFGAQNLTRRLGLPVIPLACLFIRATLQTYHMFVATTLPAGPAGPAALAPSTTSLALNNATAAAPPALARLDVMFRSALGRSSFGGGAAAAAWWRSFSLDDAIALATMLVFFLALYLVLLACKLLLGMLLLAAARERYRGMRAREQESYVLDGSRRLGGWGVVEVGEERRRWIYDGDPEGLKALREREARARDKAKQEGKSGGPKGGRRERSLDSVDRYSMVAKRIW